jgi:hypothetical protein
MELSVKLRWDLSAPWRKDFYREAVSALDNRDAYENIFGNP